MDATTRRQMYFGDYSSEMIRRVRLIARRSKAGKRNKKIIKYVAFSALALMACYTVIGLVSLLEYSDGAGIAYSPFWHGPWHLIASLLTHFKVS